MHVSIDYQSHESGGVQGQELTSLMACIRMQVVLSCCASKNGTVAVRVENNF